MVRFEVIFTNIALTTLHHSNISCFTYHTHSSRSPYYVFIVLVFYCILVVSQCNSILFLKNNFAIS